MKLLIFTVAGPDDASLSQDVANNIIEMNPLIDISFVVINNSGSDISLKYPHLENLTIVKGIPNNFQYPPSVHHAMAINYFLATISSIEYDYFLLLDPDIIQIKPNAISSIVTKMEITNASVYSFPWHLKWYSKARSRTTPHFMLFSREILQSRILNFSPSLNYSPWPVIFLRSLKTLINFVLLRTQNSTLNTSTIPIDKPRELLVWANPFKIFISFVISRFAINSVKDTGYRNSYKLLESHCFKPIIGGMFISSTSVRNIYHLRNKYLSCFEKYIIPNCISFLPQLPEYIYSDKYENIESQFNIEIMSIDFKTASFAHMRKFTQLESTHSVSSIKAAFSGL